MDNNIRRKKIISAIAKDAGISFEDAKKRSMEMMSRFPVSLVQIQIYRLWALSDQEIEAFADSREKEYQEYIQRICSETGWTQAKADSHLNHCYYKYHLFPTRYMAMRCWRLDDATLDTYLTTADQYALVEKYNNPAFERFFDNKPLFNETFKDYIGRDFWTSGAGRDPFARFIKGKSQIFCKPLSAFGGHGVRMMDIPNLNGKAELDALHQQLSAEPTLFEECICQHPHMAGMHSASVNSTRIVTILKDGVCHILFAFVRFGNGSIVDNFSSGGICAAVDEKTGTIITQAVDLAGNVYDTHPASGIRFQGFQIPMWEDVLALVDKACRIVPQVAYVGWDVAITPEGPILIEGNTNASMTSYQTCFGLQGIGKRYLIEPYL